MLLKIEFNPGRGSRVNGAVGENGKVPPAPTVTGYELAGTLNGPVLNPPAPPPPPTYSPPPPPPATTKYSTPIGNPYDPVSSVPGERNV